MIEHHTHYRRCHLCGCLSEVENAYVHKCQNCGKAFAPFVFFDEKEHSSFLNQYVESVDDPHQIPKSENRQDLDLKNSPSYKLTRLAIQSKYPPLIGLTVYW